MSAKSALGSSTGGDQHGAPDRSQRSPERPRGKSKRTLIESACSACQKRKSRCDGNRPACSRCQTLRTQCVYHAEEGESRWAALRRRTHVLERERDEAREIIAQIQSRPEPEAQEIYNHLRTNIHSSDLGSLIHEVASDLPEHTSQQGQHPDQQQRSHEFRPHSLQLQPQSQTSPQAQSQNQNLQIPPIHPQTQTPFTRPDYATVGPAPQLPPLRSVVGEPLYPVGGSSSTIQRALPPTLSPQRNMSLGSGVSTGSYSSASSDGHEQHSLSPRDDQPRAWTQFDQ